jgi:hypothetical protein
MVYDWQVCNYGKLKTWISKISEDLMVILSYIHDRHCRILTQYP